MELENIQQIKKPDPAHKAGSSNQTGFPSPATHYLESRIDLNLILTKNRDATFFVRIKGDGWHNHSIYDKDVLIVDRSLKAVSGKLVILVRDGDFKIERISDRNTSQKESVLWGVITFIIHTL